jgi:hypothetical protein
MFRISAGPPPEEIERQLEEDEKRRLLEKTARMLRTKPRHVFLSTLTFFYLSAFLKG